VKTISSEIQDSVKDAKGPMDARELSEASGVELCSKILKVPIIAGGGVQNKEEARVFVESGADIIVMSTFLEENILNDNGSSLKVIIDEIKDTGKSIKKNYKKGRRLE